MKIDLGLSFPLSSTLDLHFNEQLGGCLPYRCTRSMLPVSSGVQVAYLLLLFRMCYLGYFMFFVVYICFPCVYICLVWSLFQSYIHLTSVGILVTLISLRHDHMNSLECLHRSRCSSTNDKIFHRWIGEGIRIQSTSLCLYEH